MAITWKIVAVHELQGSIEVLYRDPDTGLASGPWNIDLPIVAGEYPPDAEIDRIINGHLPVGIFERAAALAKRPSMSRIVARVGEEGVYDPNVFVTRAGVIQCEST